MTQFKDWAIIFVGSILHYELVDTKEAEDAELYRQACYGVGFSLAYGGDSSCVGAYDNGR